MSRILTVVAVLVTYAAIVGTVPGLRTWVAAASVASLMILPVALCSSVFAWVAWRLSPIAGTAWFAAATAMIGAQWPLLLLDDERGDDRGYGWVGLVSSGIVVGLGALLVVRVARRHQLRVPPIPVGVGIGLLLVAASAGWARLGLDAEVAAARGVVVAVLVAVGGLAAFALVRSASLPLGVGRLATATLLWTWSTALGVTDLVTHPAGAVLIVTTGLAAAALLAGVAVDLLLLGMSDEMATMRGLERELSILRDQTRADVEHLHEVKGTIAGIASASALISGERRLPTEARDRLAQMLTAEAARLHRMFDDEASPATPVATDVDDIVRPLVVAHRVQGHDVIWHPPPVPLTAPADQLAVAVNILLHNASEHAPGAPVWIYTRTSGEAPETRVELVVVDLGPGIPEDQQQHIFTWGWRGPSSEGRGVGLAIAADLVANMGGRLRLDLRQRPGCTFVIELPDRRPHADIDEAMGRGPATIWDVDAVAASSRKNGGGHRRLGS